MLKIKLKIIYDGTFYYGWQRQNDHPSIQKKIEDILSKLFQFDIKINGAGRTDRGVHAKGQIASCFVPDGTNIKSLFNSINSLLPKDIRILSITPEKDLFHARYNAKGKKYSYSIQTTKLLNPFLRYTYYHHPYPIDINLIEEAIPLFIGKQNFSSFY